MSDNYSAIRIYFDKNKMLSTESKLLITSVSENRKVAFAIYSTDDNSLTFYADDKVPDIGDTYNDKQITDIYIGFDTVEYEEQTEVPWYSVRDSIKYVYIDISFSVIHPLSTSFWFRHFENISDIDLSYLDTSETRYMQQMFRECTNLINLDLSMLNVENVIRAANMMLDCYSLQTLNLGCWNTGNMRYLASFCHNCESLKTIYADRDFVVSEDLENDTNMFYGDTSIVGGEGTTYDADKVDISMAHIDTLNDPGYFTKNSSFAIYNQENNSLTFYSGPVIPSQGDTYNKEKVTYVYIGFAQEQYTDEDQVPWHDISENVHTVKFDESFSMIHPISTAFWFAEFTNCTSIDVQYLDTRLITTMEEMFYHCESVSTLDVSNWITSKVTNLHDTFSGMEKVEYLDVSNWDVRNVTTMYGTFYDCKLLESIPVENWQTDRCIIMHGVFDSCSSLKSVDLGNWNTSKVTDITRLFYFCTSLTSADVSNFDTSNVKYMGHMFRNCSACKTIYSDDSKFVTTAVKSGEGGYMFYGCTSLVGGNGTVYSSSHVDYDYAHVDTVGKPGYFTAK